MKLILTIGLFLIGSLATYAQDTIIKKNGEKVICRVFAEDSARVDFVVKKNETEIKTFLMRDQITEIRFKPRLVKDSLETTKPAEREIQYASAGIGLGLDYGGIGINVAGYPVEQVGLFVGLGYNLADIGFNAGIKLRMVGRKKSTATPFFVGMYGYNTVIIIGNRTDLSRIFYGPSLGFGIEFFLNPRKNNSFIVTLLLPIRDSNVINNYMDDLKKYGVKFENELFPVTFSIGYNF